MLTASAHLNPDIPIWRGAQLGSNGVYHYSNPQHGRVMSFSLYQPLGHGLSWQSHTHFDYRAIYS